jgi:hypothetical protein
MASAWLKNVYTNYTTKRGKSTRRTNF